MVALLAACGFTPVYGPGGEGGVWRNAVLATEPDTDFTFAFVRQFEERLGQPVAPAFTLGYDIAIDAQGLAIDGSNNVTRFNVEGVIDWAVRPDGADIPILTGTETAFVSYSASGSPLAVLEAKRDAERRLAVVLADRVVARLLAEAP